MEKEISSGTMLGIVLIALAAVIGLGFGVFSIAKGVANEGTVGVQDNLGTVSESAFDDYNDKIVTGTMVKSAIQNFKGKSVAILVNTTAMDKEVVTYSSHVSSQNLVMTNGKVSFKAPGLIEAGKKLAKPANSATKNYINYNALFGGQVTVDATTGKTTVGDMASEGSLELKDGIYNATGVAFAIDSTGKVAFDYSTGGSTRTGNCEYLAPTAKFDANLIKDETGTTIGIVFTQRAQ